MTATWTAPRTWTAGELVTASMMNTYVRDDFDWLKTPTSSGRIQFASDFTTTSTTYTDLTGVTTTITTNGGGVDIYLRLTVSNSGPTASSFQLVIDGVANAFLGIASTSITTNNTWVFVEHVAALAAGSHTFKIQVKNNGGTTTIRGTTAAISDPLFYVVERGG